MHCEIVFLTLISQTSAVISLFFIIKKEALKSSFIIESVMHIRL